MIAEIKLDNKSFMKRIGNNGSSKSRYVMSLICDIINMDEVQIIIKRMNRPYRSAKGHPAFDRGMLVGVELYSIWKKITTYMGVVDEIKDNIVLNAFVNYNPPKYTVVSNFMKELSDVWIKHIFL